MGAKDELAVAALTRALVRTGMYVDAGIDTSAGLDKPQVYAAALLNDPDLAADGLHFVMIEKLGDSTEPAGAASMAQWLADVQQARNDRDWHRLNELILSSTPAATSDPARLPR